MRFSMAPALLLLAGAAEAASKWTFSDGVVKVAAKGADTVTHKFTETEPVKTALKLTPAATLRVSLTAKEGSKGKRPHQAFVVLRDSETGLEAPFAFNLKESGAGSVDVTQKDLPVQLLTAGRPLDATLLLGSFGSSAASAVEAFRVQVELDSNAPAPKVEEPLRYGKRPEIHHVFRADPKNPPKIVSLTFALAVLATVPALFIGWTVLGGNVAHLQKAMNSAPVSHAVFFGSIIAMEGVFFLYYTSWKLFDILPVMVVVGATAFLSGSKALGEVQSRRLAGERIRTYSTLNGHSNKEPTPRVDDDTAAVNMTNPVLAFPSAEETLNHPAYPSTIWQLEPEREGKFPAARDRGGPVLIDWAIHGTGPTKLVLIMGLAGVKSSWQRQTRYFGHDRRDQYSVLILDNRGMGGSDKPLARYSTSEMARDVIEVLDHVGWTANREVNLVGISLGGMIAQEVACAIPRRLASLSLLCTSAAVEHTKTMVESVRDVVGFLVPKTEERAIADTARQIFVAEWLLAPDAEQLPDPATTPRCRPPAASSAPASDAAATDVGDAPAYRLFDCNFQRFQAQELHKRRQHGSFTRKGLICQLAAAAMHRKSPAQLKAMADEVGRERIMIMHGTGDNMITVPNGEKLIRLVDPGVGLIVPGMGHAPIMERAKWFNSLLEERLIAWGKL